MARRPRIYIPGLTLHVVQRGNNKGEVFSDSSDYRFFLKLLRHESLRCDVAIHAYALMTHHVHLLLTPERADRAPLTLKHLGQRYV